MMIYVSLISQPFPKLFSRAKRLALSTEHMGRDGWRGKEDYLCPHFQG
jgi:hypothetical protein